MVVSDNDERRKHLRVEFATAIRIVLETGEKKIQVAGNTRDLSLKGLFISTDTGFPSGTKCSIKIYLTGGIDAIELLINGTVARQSANGLGIEFDSMDVDTYSHLKNIVYYNSIDDSV